MAAKRERIELWIPGKKPNGSGGQSTEKKGTLLLSSFAEVTEMKPTREQLAEQAKFGKSIKVVLYARKNVSIQADQFLSYNDQEFTVQGPPISNALGTEWTIYAKNL